MKGGFVSCWPRLRLSGKDFSALNESLLTFKFLSFKKDLIYKTAFFPVKHSEHKTYETPAFTGSRRDHNQRTAVWVSPVPRTVLTELKLGGIV